MKILKQPKEGKILQITYNTPQIQTERTSLNHNSMFRSRYVILSNIRIDLVEYILVTRIRLLPHKPFYLPTHLHLHPSCTLNLPHHSPSHLMKQTAKLSQGNIVVGQKAWKPLRKSMTSHAEISEIHEIYDISWGNLVTAKKHKIA